MGQIMPTGVPLNPEKSHQILTSWVSRDQETVELEGEKYAYQSGRTRQNKYNKAAGVGIDSRIPCNVKRVGNIVILFATGAQPGESSATTTNVGTGLWRVLSDLSPEEMHMVEGLP